MPCALERLGRRRERALILNICHFGSLRLCGSSLVGHLHARAVSAGEEASVSAGDCFLLEAVADERKRERMQA